VADNITIDDVTATTVTAESDRSENTELQSPNTGGALVEADLLVEDVSIDGMCGVY
jgi:mycofactocin precursor